MADLNASTPLLAPRGQADSHITHGMSQLHIDTPAFVLASGSTLNPTAPSFLLSPLAMFNPYLDLEDKEYTRLNKKNLVLHNARNGTITSLGKMMDQPQHGQVGRYLESKTYRFSDGRKHPDLVLKIIRSTVTELKKKHFNVFEPKFTVEPVDDAPPVWPVGMNESNIKLYKFGVQEKYGDPGAWWASILPHGFYPTADTIHLYDAEKKNWVVLGEWLRAFCTSYSTWYAWLGYRLQLRWYKVNGGSFRFLDLPPELREHIYLIALGGEIYPLANAPSSHAPGRLTMGIGYHRKSFQTYPTYLLAAEPNTQEVRRPVYEPDLGLMGVNRQLRDEYLFTAWVRARSCFFDAGIFQSAVDARVGSAMRFKYLGKVELNLTNAAYFGCFGVVTQSQLILGSTQSLGPRLECLENLHDLRLRFRSLDDGWEGSPWGNLPEKRDLVRYGGAEYICCQRTTVDWICTFAYSFLISKKNLTVTLAGAVKTDTKDEWQAIFANKRD